MSDITADDIRAAVEVRQPVTLARHDVPFWRGMVATSTKFDPGTRITVTVGVGPQWTQSLVVVVDRVLRYPSGELKIEVRDATAEDPR